VDFADLRQGRCGVAANSPDGLIGHHERPAGGGNAAANLGADDLADAAGGALRLSFTNADDRNEARAGGR
jgi:hypothetical protein